VSRRPITADDLLSIRFLGQVELSPDGKRAVYVVTTADRGKDAYRSALHMLDLASGESRQFTSGTAKDTQPLWSPDEKTVAFLSNRSGKNQIWLIEADGGEARQLTRLAAGVGDHSWSPDGQFLAFTSSVKAGEEPAEEGKDEKDKDKSDVRVITRLKYKSNGVGFLGEARKHIFVAPASGGAVRQVTFGECDDENPSWSPDGRNLAFSANRTEDADYTRVRDIWTVSAVAGEPVQVTRSPGPVGGPQWSSDGKTIYCIGSDDSFQGATHASIWSVPAGGGDLRRLTDQDLAVGGSVIWDMTTGPTGKPYRLVGDRILFLAPVQGQAHLFAVPLAGGKAAQLTAGPRKVISYTAHSDGRIAACISDDLNPGDVYLVTDGKEKRLTELNADLLAQLDLTSPEVFSYKGVDGWDCQGWVLKPPGFRSGQRYPAILEIHGGPHAMYGHAFFHEMHYLAAQGYVVVYTNPRGSQGYGQEFTNACRGDWGGKDYQDIMLGLDAVIEGGYVDTSRLGVTGGSYGGYMTGWVVTQTDRFKAAVTQRSVTNRYSFYGTSDIGPLFGESEFPGNPWENHDVLFERSPVHHVQDIRTPLLIIHSEEDLRCPIEQSEELFIALKRMRRTVEFARFPGENHELSRSGKPKHRIERLERIAGWFKRYL